MQDNTGIGLLLEEIEQLRRENDELRRAEQAFRERELQLRSMIGNMLDIVTQTDAWGIIQYASPSNETILGYKPEDMQGRSVFDLVHPDDLDRTKIAFQTGISAAAEGKQEYRVRHADGHYLWVEVVGKTLTDDEGNVTGAVFGGRDITDRKLIEEKMRQVALELQAVFHAIPDLFFRFSADGTYQELLAGRPSDLYLTADDVLGKRVQDVSKWLGRQFLQAIDQVLRTQSLEVIEYPLPLEGETRFFEARFLPLIEDQVIVVVRNITERKQAEERLRYLSFHDIMTGSYNRTYFEEELRRLDTRRQVPLSIIIGDIDGLKTVNDTLGHRKGDQLIIKVAEVLKRMCRAEDMVCRWGGDEFAILLPKTDNATAEMIIDRIRRECEKTKEGSIPASISLGVATKKDSDQNIEDILREAEDDMYRDKMMGSKRTRFSVVSYFQRALAERTQETAEQGRRIQSLVLKFGGALGLLDKEKEELGILAALHDIGEIAVPENIILKPGSLTPAEWEIIKKHPEIGNNIARSVPDLVAIGEAILSHHEHWDGTGYPRGLQGAQIPLTSRILAIIDAYDAMTGGRPYKKAISHQEAIEEIERCAGTQFDPELAGLFTKIVSDAIRRH